MDPEPSFPTWEYFAAFLDAFLDSGSSPDDDQAQSPSKRPKLVSDAKVEPACKHPKVFGNMCADCGKHLRAKKHLPFNYIHNGFKLSRNEVARLRKEEMQENLLRNRKLILVLDLDHTLIHTKQIHLLRSREMYLEDEWDYWRNEIVSLFRLQCADNVPFFLKLRPFIHGFLHGASELFDMYIYTMGSRDYAREIIKVIDPQNKYFNARVISRNDAYEDRKDLDLVLGPENAVVIVDDTIHIWTKHRANLVTITKYHYFASKSHSRTYAVRNDDESEAGGMLSTTLEVLRMIHTHFFHREPGWVGLPRRDVRQIISRFRAEILKGCRILFVNLLTSERLILSAMAKRLGAFCAVQLDSSVTHVVTQLAGAEEFQWARQDENNFLVRPHWLSYSYESWHRQPEDKFSLNETS